MMLFQVHQLIIQKTQRSLKSLYLVAHIWDASCEILNAPARLVEKFNMDQAIKKYENRIRNGDEIPGGLGGFVKELLGL